MPVNPHRGRPSPGGKAAPNPVFDNIVKAVGPERAARLYADFTLDTRDRVERMDDATTSGDVAALQQEAHDLRGTAGHFGFKDLSDLAGEIEAACRSGDPRRAHELARRVERAAKSALEASAVYGRPGG